METIATASDRATSLYRGGILDHGIGTVLVWGQGSIIHIAARSHPVQEAWGYKIVCTGVKFKSCFNEHCQNPTDSSCYNNSEKKFSLTDLYMMYRFVVGLKVKDQVFGSTGVKQVKMPKFCWQWSQNVHQVNTIKNQNSLTYVRCFVTMVMQQRRSVTRSAKQWTLTFSLDSHANETCHIWQTILNLNCIYKMSILRPLPAELEHFYLFDPCRAKHLTFDLFFDNNKTICRS